MTLPSRLPRVIRGSMGVAVSDWRLANAVARTGQLGVVSGSMLDTVFVRRLQDGHAGGHVHRAIAAFPSPKPVRKSCGAISIKTALVEARRT